MVYSTVVAGLVPMAFVYIYIYIYVCLFKYVRAFYTDELAGPELCPTTVPKCWLKQSQAGAPASLKCACTGTVGPVSLMRPTTIKNALHVYA